jgi:hypothetical protein
LALGDQNTHYFHKFSNFRKSKKTIWELKDHDGNSVKGFKGPIKLGVQHFQHIYKEPVKENIGEIMKVVSYFPRMIEEEKNKSLFRVATKEELRRVLHTFQKDKSLGLDGWPAEFYLDFFEVLGDDILKVVEDIMLLRKVPSCFIATFIALIPKIDCPENLDVYMPISLCNYIYKIMYNVLVLRLNQFYPSIFLQSNLAS